MLINKEITNALQENYEKVRKLIDEDSKHDPESNPYTSKYAALAILLSMKSNIEEILQSISNTEQKIKYEAMLGAVLLNIGIINMETEELSASEETLTAALDILETNSLAPQTVVALISVYNHLGILKSYREETPISENRLNKAESLYRDFKKLEIHPWDIAELFKADEEDTSEPTGKDLEKAHTLTLYYLAQVYGSLKDAFKSAVYCHNTLKRQLEYKDYDSIDWALNAATLSQFFAEKNGFKQSRHHLAAASTILDIYEKDLVAEQDESETYDSKMETFKHRSADVARCWSKYCIMLLNSSRDRLLSDDLIVSANTDLANCDIPEDSTVSRDDLGNLYFPNFDVTDYENIVTDKFALTFTDAREIFLAGQNWLNKAKEYYQLNTLASDYVKIVQDNAQLYGHLAFFEEDEERQAKMHKRQINLLDDVLKEINPTYYLEYCRQLWFEIGLRYSEILDIKLNKLQKSNDRPTPHALQKINTLCEESINHFQKFLDSFENKKPGSEQKLELDIVRSKLVAYTYLGRLNMKIISPDKNVKLTNVKRSLAAYQAVVHHCDKDKEAAASMQEEYSLCREMVRILLLKLKKLETELLA